jgi:hypothetical protein
MHSSRSYGMSSSGGRSHDLSISPPADFNPTQSRIGSSSGSRRLLTDGRSYSLNRRVDRNPAESVGSSDVPAVSRFGRSAGSRNLDVSRPSLRDSVRRDVVAEAGVSRMDVPSRDSIARYSLRRDSSEQAPIMRDRSSAAGVDGSSLRGSDSVARRISRPASITEHKVQRSTDALQRISRDADGSLTETRSGLQRMTRAPEIRLRSRALDASERLTRRTDVETLRTGVSRIGRDAPISRTLDSVTRNTTDRSRIAIGGSPKVSNSSLADALSIRRGVDQVRRLSRASGVKSPIEAAGGRAIRRVTDPVSKATSALRVRPLSVRTSFDRNAGSQLARNAARGNDIILAARHGRWDGGGHGSDHGHGDRGRHGDWGHGDWGHGWHGSVHGWYGHRRWYFRDYHWGGSCWPYYGFGFGFGYLGGPWCADWGFRYAYPWCSVYGYWPPATVYYSYSYPYWYYPPVVYSSVCYTPFYGPVYYSAPVVPVFPSYYYPAYSAAYYNPSLYYVPPAADIGLGSSFELSPDWTVQNEANSTPAGAAPAQPEAKDLSSPATVDASVPPGEGNLDMGLKALQAGQIERARALLAQAINADPNNGVARMLYTAALVADGQYKEAALSLRDSLQIWRDVQLRDFYLPNVYADAAAQARYLRDLRAFLSDHPDRLDGWMLTIWSYAFSGRTDQAESLLAEAKKTWPDDPGLAKLDAIVRVG